MFIKLTETRALTSDSHGYKLCRLKTDKEGTKWQPYAYAGNLKHLLTLVPEQMLKESDVSSLKEAVALLKHWRDFLTEELRA